MGRTVKLNDIDSVVSALDYPVSRETAVEEYADVTLSLADGEENMGDIISQSSDDTFDSTDDLENELMNLLPRHAVGEPYQSEGDG